MPYIKPLRDYSEHEVTPFFAPQGALPFLKGTFVKIQGSGFVASAEPVDMMGNAGAAYTNSVSTRWQVPAKVVACTASSDLPIGITLYDVREVDENSESLLYNPHKQVEMQAVLTGQACPILFKGTILYSGVVNGPATGGATAYLGAGGVVSNTGTVAVGKFLGSLDPVNNYVLLKLDL